MENVEVGAGGKEYIICHCTPVFYHDNIPNEVKCEKDWSILKVEGPLDFSLIGILSAISTILANNKISIFVISTYDTDYILVKDSEINKAIDVLSKERHEIVKE